MTNEKEDEHVKPGEDGRVAFLSRHRQAPRGEAMTISIAPLSPHAEQRIWAERQYNKDGRLENVEIPVVSLEGIDLSRYDPGREAYILGN